MVYEFEGRTEKEAIDRAAAALGLGKDDFDVEILEVRRAGLFKIKKGYVKIRVHLNQSALAALEHAGEGDESRALPDEPPRQKRSDDPEAKDDFEQKILDFIEGIVRRMGYDGKASVLFREDRKIGFKIDSAHSSILIGKKGKNLDALQLLVNIYAGRQGQEDIRVILDTENYRIRREESLVRLAFTVADRVRERHGSVLLEPMNPFDRRLIHTTLNDLEDVETKSEGEGLYKQVRVYYRGGH